MAATLPALLASVQADARLACGIEAVWKDGDPALWRELAPAVSQHRCAHCRAVKADAGRAALCRRSDNLLAGDWRDDRPRLRRCPFGVLELVVPFQGADGYQGCLYLGPWRNGRAPAVSPATWRRLPPFPGRARALAIGRLLAARLAGLGGLRSAARSQAGARARDDALMARAVEEIGRRLHPHLRAAAVAGRLGLSASRFMRRFRQATGETFHRHLQRRLMQAAAERLLREGIAVLPLALDLGYGSAAAFTATFRRVHGLPPGRYRRQAATPA